MVTTTRFSLLTLIVCSALNVGCATVGNWYDATRIKVGQSHELAKIRRDTRERLAEERLEAMQIASERELQQLKVDLERERTEMQFCQANMEAQRQMLQSQIQENIQSKVAFDVQHGLEIGELEVDVNELEALLEQRKRDEEVRQREAQHQAEQQGCGCEKIECGCFPGVVKGVCQNCSKTPCQHGRVEKDCGGPAAYQQALTSPQRQPLRPTEIPLKLPVRLSFGMQNPQIEDTRILRGPAGPSPQQLQQQQQQKDCVDRPVQNGKSGFVLPVPPEPEPSAVTD